MVKPGQTGGNQGQCEAWPAVAHHHGGAQIPTGGDGYSQEGVTAREKDEKSYLWRFCKSAIGLFVNPEKVPAFSDLWHNILIRSCVLAPWL